MVACENMECLGPFYLFHADDVLVVGVLLIMTFMRVALVVLVLGPMVSFTRTSLS